MFLHAILMWPVAARWRVAPGRGAAGALERASPVAVARRRARAVCTYMAGRPCARRSRRPFYAQLARSNAQLREKELSPVLLLVPPRLHTL